MEYSLYLSEQLGGEVWLKPDSMQRTASFKFRGAVNKILSLTRSQLDQGLVSASTGNFALAVAEARDPKGLYKKARRGELKGLTGIDQPYEAPTSPDLVVKTDEADLEACGRLVVSFLENEGILSR